MHGVGVINYPDGKIFIGEFREDQKHGEGNLFDEDKVTRFKQAWQRDKMIQSVKGQVSANELELQLNQPWLNNSKNINTNNHDIKEFNH